MDIEGLKKSAKDITSFSAKAILAYEMTQVGGQVQSLQAADISTSEETSNVYSFPTQTPVESYMEEVGLNVELQTNPEPNIPVATATPNGLTNVRSEPTTTSEKLGSVDAGTSLNIEGYIDATDGFRWYYSRGNGQNEWYRSDRLTLGAGTENLYDLGAVAQIPVADENGKPTEKKLISTQVDLAETKWVFDALQTQYGFPAETFQPSSLVLLSAGRKDTLFQQIKDISTADGKKNEATSILGIQSTDAGIVPVYLGPGQVGDYISANGVPVDNTRALRGGNLPEGTVLLTDQTGAKAIVDYAQVGENLLSSKSTFTDAITLLPADFPQGEQLTDMGDGKFVGGDGTVYVKQLFSTGLFEIKRTDEKILNPGIKGTPEDQAVLEIAKFNQNPQMDSGDGTYKVYFSDNYVHQVLGASALQVDSAAVLDAKRFAIEDGFSSMNQRLTQVGKPTLTTKDEVVLGAYTNGHNMIVDPQDSFEIKGKIERIKQFVVTDDEYQLALQKAREKGVKPMLFYIFSSAALVNQGYSYFDSNGDLSIVNKPLTLGTHTWSPIADGPATLDVLLDYGLPFGMTKMSAPGKNSADPIYSRSFRCDPSTQCAVIPTITIIP